MKRQTKRKIVRTVRKAQRFWDEWGMTREEFGYLVGALAVVLFPFILSIISVFINDLMH